MSSIEKHVMISQFNIHLQGLNQLRTSRRKLDRLEDVHTKYMAFGLTDHIQDYNKAILEVKAAMFTITSKIL